MIRIFVAFPIPQKWSESFLEISEKNSSLEKFRWTPKDNLHITLFFIGEVEQENLGKISTALDTIFIEQHSFSLEFDSVELRGRKKYPSMLWGKFIKNESFTELAGKISKSVKEFMTIEDVYKDPIPHCTLARIKPGADASMLKSKIVIPHEKLLINTAELWQTRQTAEGVTYGRLNRWKLTN